MEFLLYLTPVGNQIINTIAQSKFKIYENSQLCKVEPNTMGYVDHDRDQFVVCTKNIINGGWSPKHYINQTVYHEAVHVAQDCKSKGLFSFLGPVSLGIPNKYMPLTANKKEALDSSTSFGGFKIREREHESYYLEDKPHKVLHYVQKYCL